MPSPGKLYYTVFPKSDTDISKTGDFIKQLVGVEDLLPWSDVNDNLMHWTVEASLDQVSQLQGNTGIDHVDEFNPPAPPTTTQITRDIPAVDWLAERQNEPTEKYMVWATDGKNQDQTNQTEQYLQNLVGKENVRPPFIFDDEIRYWLCISKFFMSLFPLYDSEMSEYHNWLRLFKWPPLRLKLLRKIQEWKQSR